MATSISGALAILSVTPPVRSLVVSNVFSNINTILSFLPAVIALFFFLSVLRSDNCVTHMTFIVSGVLHGVNLSNSSFIPVVVNFNYDIPTVVTSHALTDRHSHGVAVVLAPFVDYDTGLPVCNVFVTTFFPRGNNLIVLSLCLANVYMTVLSNFLLGDLIFHNGPIPFIVRLPTCHLPATHGVVVRV